MKDHHSALKPEKKIDKELSFWYNNGSYVFEWDIMHGAHMLFDKCDCVLSDLPWRNGYNKFMSRANQHKFVKYNQFLDQVGKIVLLLSKPTYILCGKHMLNRLNPEQIYKSSINSYGAYIAGWNTNDDIDGFSFVELVKYVSKKYNMVLDFCCGYGSIARHASKFICSDINRKCIYFVAKKYMWFDD